MSDQPIGLSFRETMAGGFILGETDPEAGRREGERTGIELAMHATIAIRDLDRFLAEPNHSGALSGTSIFRRSAAPSRRAAGCSTCSAQGRRRGSS